jgi:hypothetical protein
MPELPSFDTVCSLANENKLAALALFTALFFIILRTLLSLIYLIWSYFSFVFSLILSLTFGEVVPVLNQLNTVIESVQPILTLFSFFSFIVLMWERIDKHKKRIYERTCTIGWNTFVIDQKKEDGSYRYKLIMPSEETFDLHEIFEDDPELEKKVFDAMKRIDNSYKQKDNTKQAVFDFIVYLDNPHDEKGDRSKDQREFMRRVISKISSVANSSNWGDSAHNGKLFQKDIYEPVKCLFTFEKDAPVKTPRIWLIFAQELEMFKNFPDFDCSAEELQQQLIANQRKAEAEAALALAKANARANDSVNASANAVDPSIALANDAADPLATDPVNTTANDPAIPPPKTTNPVNVPVKAAVTETTSSFFDYFTLNYFKSSVLAGHTTDVEDAIMKAKTEVWKRKISPYFLILKDDWYLRIVNLQKWANTSSELLKTISCDNVVYLPYHRKTEQTILCQWLVVANNQLEFLVEDKSPFASYFPLESFLLDKVLNVLSKKRTKLDLTHPANKNKPLVGDLQELMLTMDLSDSERFRECIKVFLSLKLGKSAYAHTCQHLMYSPGQSLRKAVYIIFYDPKDQQTHLWITLPEFFALKPLGTKYIGPDAERKKEFLKQWIEMRAKELQEPSSSSRPLENQTVPLPLQYNISL